jgi:apolipoprotein N-acyltransferase
VSETTPVDAGQAPPPPGADTKTTASEAPARRLARKNKSAPCADGREPIVSSPVAFGLATLSGLLYFLAFPGVDFWPLAFVALVPLYVSLRGQSPRRAAALGWVAGFVMTMTGFYWLLTMLQTFSGFSLPLCFLFMSILCAYQAGRMALTGWLYARAERNGWPAGVTFVFAMGAGELLFPLLFPWTYAATVHQLPAFLQVAELGGQLTVALVLVFANLAVAEPIVAWLEHRKARGATPPTPGRELAQATNRTALRARTVRVVARYVAVVVGALVYGAVRIPQVDAAVAAAPKAHVGVVQANMSLLGKRRDRVEGLKRHLELTHQLKQQGPLDLAVWSETSVAGVKWENEAALVLRKEVSSRTGVPTLFGAVLARPVEDAREYALFNSAVLSDSSGALCEPTADGETTDPNHPACRARRYDKHYLLAFGEYLPFGEDFPILYEWSPNSGQFSKGKHFEPLVLGDKQLAVFICYEDILPDFVNNIVRQGSPDLLVNMTNDAWFGDTTEPWIHFALAKFRAVEHRRYLVRSTNSGVSGFIDPVGRTVRHGGTFKQEAFTEEVRYLRGNTAFNVVGQSPWWLTAFAIVLAGFVPAARVRRRVRPS